jgi:hypothetical protein
MVLQVIGNVNLNSGIVALHKGIYEGKPQLNLGAREPRLEMHSRNVKKI